MFVMSPDTVNCPPATIHFHDVPEQKMGLEVAVVKQPEPAVVEVQQGQPT
jgi:hypothetical protein